MALQRKISRRKLRQMVGRSFPVLVEGRSEETELLFRAGMESQAPGIDGQVLINDYEGAEPRLGEFRWATITDAGDYDLVSRLEARTFAERAVPSSPGPAGPRLVQIQAAGAMRLPLRSPGHAMSHLPQDVPWDG